MHRRDFLSNCSLAAGGLLIQKNLHGTAKTVLEYGARPDGKTLNTKAIQRAIDDVFQSGGGTVIVPAGVYLTGRIELKSRVTLNLEEGSTLLGSTLLSDYSAGSDLPQKGINSRHLLSAWDADDVTLSGQGRIDGQGSTFWEPSGKAPLPEKEQWADVASHALAVRKGGRPSPMLQFVNCRRLKIQDIKLENSPGWTLHVVNSDEVEIHGISIRNPINGPNTDGVDITGCQNVTISDSSIETGDDAICLKSENPYGPEPRLLKDIEVTNCRLTTCCNGFKLGTSSEGGFENITFSNSVVYSDQVSFSKRVISAVALEVVDGGWIDGVVVKNIQMRRSRTPLFIRLENRKRVHEYPQHGLRNVMIQDIDASEGLLASSITGIPGSAVQGVTLSRVSVENVLLSPESVGRSVPEKETAYPEARMFGMLPASGLYVRHVRDLNLNGLTFKSPSRENRPTIVFVDVNGARLSEIQGTPIDGGMPMLEQIDSRDVRIARSAEKEMQERR